MSRSSFTRFSSRLTRRRALLTGGIAGVVVLALGTVALLGGATGVRSGGGDHLAAPSSAGQAGGVTWDGADAPMAPAYQFADEAREEAASDNAGAGESAGSMAAPMPTDGDGAMPPFQTGRQIIRNGSIDLEVEAVQDAFDQVRTVASSHGGFVAESSFGGDDEHQSARLTVRVPAERFDDVVTELRGVATEVRGVSTSSQDVTGEYTDIEATLRNLRAVEQQYVTLLGRADAIGDVLQVQDRLNQVRLQIDRTEARRQMLDSLTEMATLSVSLSPTPDGAAAVGGPLAAAAEAWAASLRAIETVATAAIVVVVFSWWLVPVVVVLALVVRRLWRRDTPGSPPAAV